MFLGFRERIAYGGDGPTEINVDSEKSNAMLKI